MTTDTQTDTGVSKSAVQRLVNRDWQLTTILADGLFIETDWNTGDKRRIRKSRCSCGKPVLIEYSTTGFRKDGKRIFYPERDYEGYHVFRCVQCRQPVDQTVPHAEFDYYG